MGPGIGMVAGATPFPPSRERSGHGLRSQFSVVMLVESGEVIGWNGNAGVKVHW